MTQTASLSLRTKQPPNVIWFLVDQLRAQALGYRGDPNVSTPNIDNLARESRRFDAAVSGSPWCSPFRGALLTGLYPHRNGVTRTPLPLDPSLPTIAAPFREAGYHTAWIGKWHLDGSNSREHYVPPERRGGFDYWMGYENNNNQNEVFVYGSEDEHPRRLPGYETDSLTDLFIGHLKSHVGAPAPGRAYQPFFACLSVQPPHDPFVGPTNPGYLHTRYSPASIRLRENVPPVAWVQEAARLDAAGYYAMIENLDDNLGRLRMALKAFDIDRETYIVFFADHGEMLGSHAQWGKVSPWEESIRIPFLIGKVGGPQNTQVGITDAVLNHVDIAPTSLGLCGIAPPPGMVGYDYSGYCLPGKKADRAGEPDAAFLQQICAVTHPHRVDRPWRGVVTRDGWKYVAQPGHDWLLHHLGEDPLELANYVFDPAYRERLGMMRERLREWMDRTGDTFAVPCGSESGG
ncbi:MAG TPA: sulfatase [Chthoniobacteraceae bacterium]|nr:sulfatase [Chthoniobacteraceae bacterium]